MNTTDLVFNFIVQYKKDHNGNSPTKDEIAAGVHVTKQAVDRHLDKLSAQGRITLAEPGQTRSIEVKDSYWIYAPDFTEAQRNGHEAEAIMMQLEHMA